MSLADWHTHKADVRAIREPPGWMSHLMWFGFALIPAGVLAFVPWLVAYGALPAASQLTYAWIGPLFLGISVVGIVGGGVCYFASKSFESAVAQDKGMVIAKMEAMEKRYGIPPEDA